MDVNQREVVVITGAGAGVGRAVVNEFAAHGAGIGLISRNSERLESAKRQVEQAGGRALPLPCDVAHADEVEGAAERVENEPGANEGAGPGEGCAGGLSPRVSLDSIAIAILRSETRDGGIHRFAALRADSSEEQCSFNSGPFACHEYAPVQLAPYAAAAASAACTADLRARGSGRDLPGGASQTARSVCGRVDREGDLRAGRGARVCRLVSGAERI